MFPEFLFVLSVMATGSVALNSYISIGRCDEWEQDEFERQHLDCTRQVEERYSLILERFEVDLPSHGSSRFNRTRPAYIRTQVGTLMLQTRQLQLVVSI